MTADRFRTLVEGAVTLWRAPVQLAFDADATRCVIVGNGATTVVEHLHAAPGPLWRIATHGRTARVHRSVVPALATLREALCPDRPRGRALFVAPAADGS